MQKVSYIYSGENQTFYFNFPYFEKSNIVVTVDNKPAPAYNVIGNKGGLDPDFPFVSGRIVFVKPLKMFQTITIERHLPYNRPVDFQPMSQIKHSDLNLDMNNTMELLKDLKDEVDDIKNKYKDITDKEQIDTLLEKIALFNKELANFAEQLQILDQVPGLEEAVSSNQSTIESINATISEITSSLSTLNARTENLLDYVVESQLPTAENNYTWYRKYKSGWVEQGGQVVMSSTNGMNITLPVQMVDNSYCVFAHIMDDNQTGYVFEIQIKNKTATSFNSRMIASYQSGTWTGGYNFAWQVSGQSAE